jgi:hypothetical protein
MQHEDAKVRGNQNELGVCIVTCGVQSRRPSIKRLERRSSTVGERAKAQCGGGRVVSEQARLWRDPGGSVRPL